MTNIANLLTPRDLLSAIARNPILVSPDTSVKTAIAMMGETDSNYVLVVENLSGKKGLIGILTERDLVRIITQPMPLDQLTIQAVMSQPVITIQESTFTDINAAIALFQQHRIRHFPVLDDGDRIVGLLEKENLTELLARQVKAFAQNPIAQPQNSLEISDRKREDAKFWASEQRSQKLFDALPKISVQGYSSDRQVIYWNKASEKIYGYTSDEALGQKLENLIIPPAMRQDVINLVEAWVNGGEPIPASELTLMAKDGSSVYVYSSHVLLNNSRNEPELYCIDIDLSDRRQVESALKQSETKSQAILAAIPDVMFRVGADGIYRGFVQNRDFGILPLDADPTGKSIADLMSEEIANQQLYYMQQALLTGELQVYEQQVQIADRIQDEEVRVIKSGDDEVLFMIRNISDRKQAEAALKQSEMTNRTIIETIPDLLIQMDMEGRYLRMLAGSGVRVIPFNPPDPPEVNNGLSADLAEQRMNYAKQAIETCSLQIYEQIITFENDQRYEEVRVAPLNDQEVLIIIRDITDAKQAEFERSLNEELIRTTRLKDEFLANMSHELRTPLNAILGMTEGIQNQVFGSVNERQIKALQTIERSGNHLLELINDILDIAKIESGQMELDCTLCAVASLCQSSLAFIKQQALKKCIQLEIKLQLNLPSLLVDERRIRQVLINLLSNAVKFTPEGGRITLEVSQLSSEVITADSPLLDSLRIAVIDTGIGISPENIPKLFQPFIQIDSALNRQYEGTGLGLALVKRIVELHGGKVELTSELGVGSCFSIDLPCTVEAPISREMATSVKLSANPELDSSPTDEVVTKSPLILIAEDNEANISTFSSYLEAKGYRLLIAKDGQESINLTKAHHPDLILMDIQMPVMDGLEATKQIRLDPNLTNIPIIALTALAMASDRQKCLDAGANEYLSKPVKLQELVATIKRFL